MSPTDRIRVLHGDSREVLRQFPDNHFDSVCTDPPYALVSITKRFGKAGAAPAKGNAAYTRASAGFMGQQWDTGETAFDPEFWSEVLRVLKPGGHVAAFSGTRTYHRMAVAIEDAGFEIRDQLAWTYGSGFPKSHDVSKGIDKRLGVAGTYGDPKSAAHAGWIDRGRMRGGQGHEGYQRPCMDDKDWVDKAARRYEGGSQQAREWQGWGTALKPAWEPICLGRKPVVGTVAENVLVHGTGAINVDGCRVSVTNADSRDVERKINKAARDGADGWGMNKNSAQSGVPVVRADGRWPANIVHDGSDEVVALFPDRDGSSSNSRAPADPDHVYAGGWKGSETVPGHNDSGSAARFFYTAKADSGDRIGSKHPTVKPVDLMQWLVRLITPPGGLVLEPFAGSGTTGEAAFREGMRCVMIEREANFIADIERRIGLLLAGPEERTRSTIKAKIADGRIVDDAGPLFGGTDVAQAGRQAGRYTATSQTRTNDWPDGAQVVNE